MSIRQKHNDKVLEVSPKVDFKKVDETLIRLKNHRHKSIRSLEGPVKDDYRFIVDNLALLYETKYYKKFHDKITDCFKDVHDYKPETVGAYLNGCNVDTNLDMQIGCTPICAGSVPPIQSQYSHSSFGSTRSDSDTTCKNAVLLATWENNKRFVFTDMNDVTPRKSVLMYTSFSKISEFPGFSPNEKEHLKNYGIREVNLMYFDNNGTHFTELLNGPVKIENIKEREASASSIPPNSSTSSSSSTAPCDSNSSAGSNPNNGGGGGENGNGDNGSQNSSAGAFWLALIIIVIIILILIFLYRRNYCC
jgi:hypothetical protein